MHTWSAVETAASDQVLSENSLEILPSIKRDKAFKLTSLCKSLCQSFAKQISYYLNTLVFSSGIAIVVCVQLNMAFPSWMQSSWALMSRSDNRVPQGLPWHYSFVKHVLANSMKSLWSSVCHKGATILIRSLILNTNLLLGSYFMPPSSPLLSPARLDILSSQNKRAPCSLFHPELNANGIFPLCHVNWTARIVPISVIGHDVGSRARGKDVGNISATYILTEFIKLPPFTQKTETHSIQWGWIHKTELHHMTRVTEPGSLYEKIYTKKRNCFFGSILKIRISRKGW